MQFSNVKDETVYILNIPDDSREPYTVKCYWIGLSDIGHEGIFRWDGSSQNITYENFGPKQPDDYAGISDCAYFIITVIHGLTLIAERLTDLFVE